MIDNNDTAKTNPVKKLLAQHLGVEVEDIHDDDSFKEDLRMRTTDIVDFLELLKEKNINTENIDLTEIETFGDLIEKLDIEDSAENST